MRFRAERLYIVQPPHIDGLTSSVVVAQGIVKLLQKGFAITAPYRESAPERFARYAGVYATPVTVAAGFNLNSYGVRGSSPS